MIPLSLLFVMKLSLLMSQGKFPGGGESRAEVLMCDSFIEIEDTCHTIQSV